MTMKIVLKKGREAIAMLMVRSLGVSSWRCGVKDCRYEVSGKMAPVEIAKEKHTEIHRHDEDLAMLGMCALGLVKKS